MTLMMEILRLLVRTAPADDANDSDFEVLYVDSCFVRTLYCFWLNRFSKKLPLCIFNHVRNRFFAPNPIDKIKITVGKKLYRLGLITIPCKNKVYLVIKSLRYSQWKPRVKLIPRGRKRIPRTCQKPHSRSKTAQKAARGYDPRPDIPGRWI